MSVNADYQAIIFDMDGVLTDTRDYHYTSWKQTFDEYLLSKGVKTEFTHQDYNDYVDGKIRSEGIQSFLSSRGLEITEDQVNRLGNLKNSYFQKNILSGRLSPFREVEQTLKKLHSKGVKLAVVSASENCRKILESLHLTDLFDEILDGTDAKTLHLRGKPENDYYLTMLNHLGVDAHYCALVEDSISGVLAGKKSNLTVFGMSRTNQTSPEKLIEAGADYVISDITPVIDIPNALKHWNDVLLRLNDKEPALFLDFDGTISEIVSHPDDASLVPGVKEVLFTCSRSLKVAIISGRDRMDVKTRVGIDDIFYAGNHGQDISGPGCFHYTYDTADQYLPSLEKFNLSIESLLLGIEGLIIERKKYCTAIHFRMTNPDAERTIRDKVQSTMMTFPELRVREGKKVLEVLPDIEWGKDQAVLKLVEVLNLDLKKIIPIFIGDDTTDEEAFVGLKDKGLCIRVANDTNLNTHAHYYLSDPNEVKQFISLISNKFSGTIKRWRSLN